MTSVLSASRQANRASRSVRHKLPIAPQSLSYARAEIEISPSNGNTLHLRHGAEETDDADGVTPELLNFIITLAQYMLFAFGILIAGATVVYITLFWRGKFSGESIAHILQQTDIPKLATIIMIVLAASLLGLLRVIAGEAVIALLAESPAMCSGTAPHPRRKRRRTDAAGPATLSCTHAAVASAAGCSRCRLAPTLRQ